MLVLGHGAGGTVTAADLALLARTLPGLGVSVARFEQPYRTAGRNVSAPPAALDLAWRAAVDFVLTRVGSSGTPLPLFTGGRSAGARVACRTAAHRPELAGIVALSFPLHPPGRPEKSRLAELLAPAVPRLVLQGSRDAFGSAAEVAEAVEEEPGVRVVEVPGAVHGLVVPKSAAFGPAEVARLVVGEVRAFAGIAPGTE